MPFALEKMAELSEHFESCSSITKSNWVGRVVTYLGARTNKDAGPFDHLVFQDHVINLIRYIFTSTRPVVTRNGKVVVYCERHLPWNSHDLLITWPTWGQHSMHLPLFSGGGGGWASDQIFKKEGLDRIAIFRGGLLGKRGDFFQGVAVFP